MKITIIIITCILMGSLKSKSQVLGGAWNSAKEAAKIAEKEAEKKAIEVAKEKANGILTGTTSAAAPSLSNDEVIKGLKEALSVGTNNSSALASKADGYLKNPKLFIPWPAEAKDMRDKLIKMGMQKK